MLQGKIIKALLTKEAFAKFSPYITKAIFNEDKGYYWSIYQQLCSYYDEHASPISVEELEQLHLATMGGAADSKVAALKEVYHVIKDVDDTDSAEYLLTKIRKRGIMLSAAEELADAIDSDNESAAAKAMTYLQSLEDVDGSEDSLLYTINMLDAQDDYEASQQWQWQDSQLNDLVKGGGPGRNMLIVALTNVGKTSFAVYNAVGFMRQGAKVLHCSIAEDSKVSLQRRYYQAALALTDNELDIHTQEATEDFMKEFSGKLFLAPVDSLTVGELENLVKEIKPDVVILDDFKDLDLGRKVDMRMDKLYGSLAVRIKSLAIKYNFFAVCLAQASDSATGKKKLDRQDVADSKVDIPGKFQYVIGLARGGADHSIRYISFIKNKLGREDEVIISRLDEPTCQWSAC